MVPKGLWNVEEDLFRFVIGAIGVVSRHPQPGDACRERFHRVVDEELAVVAVLRVKRHCEEALLEHLASDNVAHVQKHLLLAHVPAIWEEMNVALLTDDEEPVGAVAGVREVHGEREA